MRITAFDGYDFTQGGINTKGGTTGNIKARYKQLHPPHSSPIDPYGSSTAPIEYKPISTKLLLATYPANVETRVASIKAKVGVKGTLTGEAGLTTKTCTARCLEVTADWEAPYDAVKIQWIHFTVTFLQQTDWA